MVKYNKKFCFRVDEDLLKRLREVVQKTGLKQSKLIREGIEMVIKKYGRERKSKG